MTYEKPGKLHNWEIIVLIIISTFWLPELIILVFSFALLGPMLLGIRHLRRQSVSAWIIGTLTSYCTRGYGQIWPVNSGDRPEDCYRWMWLATGLFSLLTSKYQLCTNDSRHLNDKFVACRSFNFNCPGVVFWRTAERTQVAVIYGVDVATMYKNYLQGEHKHHSESSIFLEQCWSIGRYRFSELLMILGWCENNDYCIAVDF